MNYATTPKINSEEPYSFAMSNDFVTWCLSVDFMKSTIAPIKPFLERLSFISDKKKWGFPFRRGCFEINREDFELIAKEMDALDE